MPDGPEIEASAAPSGKKVAVDSHAKTTVVVKKIPVNILEMEDVLFHHNSAVLMPETPETESGKKDADASAKQKKVSGVKAMALLFQFLEVNPGKRLIVAGHTDSSGGVKINFELSALRAQGVMCLVDGDRDGWAKIAFGRHKVEDYQQILRYVFQNRKWPCNPGKIDDSWGPNTKSATAAFINYYNTEFADKFKGAYTDVFDLPRLSTGETALVDRDGKHRWTEALWKAAYAIYDKTIADALKLTPKALKDRRVELIKYMDDMNRFVACGNRSRSIRRRRTTIVPRATGASRSSPSTRRKSSRYNVPGRKTDRSTGAPSTRKSNAPSGTSWCSRPPISIRAICMRCSTT
jgi:hypothetical protein